MTRGPDGRKCANPAGGPGWHAVGARLERGVRPHSGTKEVSLNVVPLTRSTTAIEYAKGLLARCEAVETVAVTAVEEQPGGTYKLQGSAVSSRTATAGMLLDAAMTRLQSDE